MLDEQFVASYDAISVCLEWQIPLDFNSSCVEDNNVEGGGRARGLCDREEEEEGREGTAMENREGGSGVGSLYMHTSLIQFMRTTQLLA